MFTIHRQLQDDLVYIGNLTISKLYMNPSSENPWAVLIPEIMKDNEDYLVEVHELKKNDRIILMEEISNTSHFLKNHFNADKINVGALGNIVPQLHVHIIARYQNDKAWPGPIWGSDCRHDPAKMRVIQAKMKSFCENYHSKI